jgi:hypothetical protein
LVVVVLVLVDFFGTAFVVVLVVGLTVDLLVAFAEVLLVVDLETGLVATLLPDFGAVTDGLMVAADASMSGLVFLVEAVARTCLIAFACCSSVTRNSW